MEYSLTTPPAMFKDLGARLIRKLLLSTNVWLQRFRAHFCVTPSLCAEIWARLAFQPSGKPIHLLWALLFLKTYSTEHVHAAFCQVDEKTFRKWAWIYIKLIEGLPIVSK